MNLKGLILERMNDGRMQPLQRYLVTEVDVNVENMINAKKIIDQVADEVKDIFETEFEFPETETVPNVDDTDLTYANGDTKKGKEITTCVLFVDIRNSVALNNEAYTKTMGRIYTAFTKTVLRAAAHCGGYVRNIIGDRVMVVFPQDNCFQNAVDCAITINHIAKYVINPKVKGHDFHCGIGIDYGTMRCIKVGVEKHGTENSDNKNLVWIGRPANMASRLCDCANKELQMFKVLHVVYEPQYGLIQPKSIFGNLERKEKTETLTAEQITEIITKSGYRSILSVEKEGKPEKRNPILVSKDVYDGFKKACPDYNSVKNGRWKMDLRSIRDVAFPVYGADLHWKLDC